MSSSQTRLSHWIAIIIADTFLLGCFLVQAFILGCLLLYSHIPLPKEFVDSFIRDNLQEGISLSASAYRIDPDASFAIQDPVVRIDGTEHPIFEASSASIHLKTLRQLMSPTSAEVLVVGSTLYLPGIYSPSGQNTPILEQAAFSLSLSPSEFILDSFAALHEDIHLRGAAKIPRATETKSSQTSATKDVQATAFSLAAQLVREKSKLEGLIDPTVSFNMGPSSEGSMRIETLISSQKLVHELGTASELEIEAALELKDTSLDTQSSIALRAAAISTNDKSFSARAIRGIVEHQQWKMFLEDGRLPNLRIQASEIASNQISIENPAIEIETESFPIVEFSGTTGAFGGHFDFSGRTQPYEGAANIRISGDVGAGAILEKYSKSEKLQSLFAETEPYVDLSLEFADGFDLKGGDWFIHSRNITLEDVTFDRIQSQGSFDKSNYHFEEIFLTRDWQWVDFTLDYAVSTKDYSLGILGSAIPYEYNALLPHWWASIFQNFDFESAHDLLGDFIIYGNAGQRAANMYFGNVLASGVSYRDVPIERGQLFLRGLGPYSEIFDMHVSQSEGWATGKIQFSSRLDHIRVPESVRLDLDASLSLEDAGKLFDPNIRSILADFETDALIDTEIEGAIFSPAYEERKGLSYIEIAAKTDEGLTYKGIPLDSLQMDLFGTAGLTYLRDMELGFLGGIVHADADIITKEGAEAQLRLVAQLENASQTAAKNLLENWGDQDSKIERPDLNPNENDGQLDLRLHAKGPVQNPYQFTGYGDFTLENESLGSIQLLGPISRALERASIGYTTFALQKMEGEFRLDEALLNLNTLSINGPRTRIESPGKLNLEDHSLDMRVSVFLFGNAGRPDSAFRKFSEMLTRPLPNLLEFELTGTLEDQQLRSLYDPRKLLPQF